MNILHRYLNLLVSLVNRMTDDCPWDDVRRPLNYKCLPLKNAYIDVKNGSPLPEI